MAGSDKKNNEVVTPVAEPISPFDPPPVAEGGNQGTTDAQSGDQKIAARKTATKTRSGPKSTALKSDARFLGEGLYQGTRKNFSTKIYPELEAQIQGIVTLAKMTGQPKGLNSVVAVIQEAVSRLVETIEEEDNLKIPKMHGR